MSFIKRIWKDRQSEYPTRRKLVSTGTQNEYDVIRSEGAVSEAGDPLNAENLNDLENRIENGFTDVNKSLGTQVTYTIDGTTLTITTK